MIQKIIVAILVIAAAVYIVRNIAKPFLRSKKGACGNKCGCSK